MIEVLLRFYICYFPIKRGKTRVIESAHKLFKFNKKVKFIHKYGFMINLDLSQFVDRQIFFFGVYEDYILNLISIMKFNTDFIIDIGANIGQHSLYAATKDFNVFSFEADPITYNKFSKNIKLNNMENKIRPINIALSDLEGFVSMVIPMSENVGGNYIQESNEDVGIKAVTLDSIIDDFDDLQGKGIIKLDVEGAEGKVLRGAINTLKEKINYIIVEICDEHLNRFDDNANELLKYIISLGYTGFFIEAKTIKKLDLRNIPQFSEICFVCNDELEIFEKNYKHRKV